MSEAEYNYPTMRRASMHSAGGPAPGTEAPDFDLATTDGGRFRLSAWRGVQPVLIEFGSLT